jgi:type I restriction enzyme, S subunit
MSFPRYECYKESGVAWLGEVPEHWRIGAIKHFVLQKSGAIKTGPFGSHLTSADMQEGEIKVYNQRNVIDNDFVSGDNFISGEKFKQLASFETSPGDLLVTTRGTIGRVAILPESVERGILHPCLLRIQVDNTHIDSRFLKMLIQDSHVMKSQLSYLSNATTIEVIYSETIASVLIAVPSINEQFSILTFLDRETAKIDALIAEQQRLIALLSEKRQAVISHAVTKGLNPAAPMKDSGIAWLGEVPEHWGVKMLKWFSTLQRGYDLTDLQREDGLYPVITSGGVSGTHSKYKSIGPGVVTGRYGSTGQLFYIEENFWPHNTALFVADFHRNYPRFVWYALQTVDFASHSAKSAVPGIDRNDIHVLYSAVPPLNEQSAIAAFLDCETVKIDLLITEAERAISLLQERRTALISAAVTGKIDVRGMASTHATTEAI